VIECEFLVQEKNFDSATEHELEQGTKEVIKTIFNTDAGVSWRRVLEGDGFTAGEGESGSSLILFVVAKDKTDETRAEVFRSHKVWPFRRNCEWNLPKDSGRHLVDC